MKISIVVPFFNEEKCVDEFFKRTLDVLSAEKEIANYEIIAVNDGSKDTTIARLTAAAGLNQKIKIVDLSRNFGHQVAISAGIHFATGDYTVILDGDLQDPPEVIAQMLKKMNEGFDVVYAVRRKRKEGLFKRACYFTFYRILKYVAHTDIPLDSGDFCVISRRVCDILKSMPEKNRFIRGLRSWLGFNQAGIEYERTDRFADKPKYSYLGLIKLAVDGLISFSSFPIKLASIVGFVLASLSLVGGIAFIVFRLIVGMSVPGITTVIVLLLFISGIQLISIGIIGEYIARIFDETKQRPLFIVKNLINLKEDR